MTACLYPYDYWGTFLASSRFALGWQERFGLDFDDLQIAGTETRLTGATFQRALDENKLVAALGFDTRRTRCSSRSAGRGRWWRATPSCTAI